MMRRSDLIGQLNTVDDREGISVRILVTGGLGFIGSHLVRHLLVQENVWVTNLDALTYAGNPENLEDVQGNPRYQWRHASITDEVAVNEVLSAEVFDAVMHLAAESHVDRSIEGGLAFVETNVVGTQILLEAARRHGVGRFLHVSTDEVYGSLGPSGLFSEDSPLTPNSPYSASKAASDLLALAAFRTHGQDVVVTRCSNNFGPNQFPEKLIPLYITNGFQKEPWPLYGDGANVRDWIYVKDHIEALWLALIKGRAGEVYNIGARNERTNREVAAALLTLLQLPKETVIAVPDRLGHDRRYAIDPSKAERELGFHPQFGWETALEATVVWYREHRSWWKAIKSGQYRDFYHRQYPTLGTFAHDG